MANPELIKYLKDNASLPREQIWAQLRKAEWPDSEIQAAEDVIASEGGNVPNKVLKAATAGAKTSKSHRLPRIIFVLLGLTVILLSAVFATMPLQRSAAQKAQRDAQRERDMSTIKLAIESYYSKNGVYPATLEELLKEHIIGFIPNDPLASTNYTNYMYDVTADEKHYSLCAVFETAHKGTNCLWTDAIIIN
ncbi:MAG: hypothetical protein A3A80_02455 [Candidatus Terrybacteria bacterium RIFCSPLOWO2_01_FULL_44_24]|uniref:Type II secretion system protein GspG C-terminal domain-containing protein n=1 Tax=Candidatus Terrybacteria bacterium RIFCSPHIGHO2_01_FULL_43_35 TaxID=1802361 RepID=A0A1G2PEE0_9BACT|nr:MAG: hypothetical protein A2828_02250 [Candidatus Terrybacteria bacterium RIFCSPHIGHO2_01_FULL_43_35]OHA50311.1 MAG: hypothetical protein A3B75_00745 [Candidatus Terrybacteria bacterium RIFCSPHIGHO2_02_FULL_43_14]OHA50935.1 MAG: hypothetical protein A3A80_02455 [Candidatus Terrybacteria bacterium RIFCSPLOWO2_01_FULL_44_24]